MTVDETILYPWTGVQFPPSPPLKILLLRLRRNAVRRSVIQVMAKDSSEELYILETASDGHLRNFTVVDDALRGLEDNAFKTPPVLETPHYDGSLQDSTGGEDGSLDIA